MKNINNIVKKVVNEAINELDRDTMGRAFVKANVDYDKLGNGSDEEARNLNGQPVGKWNQMQRRKRQSNLFASGLEDSFAKELGGRKPYFSAFQDTDSRDLRKDYPDQRKISNEYQGSFTRGDSDKGKVRYSYGTTTDGRPSVDDRIHKTEHGIVKDDGYFSGPFGGSDFNAAKKIRDYTDALAGYHDKLAGDSQNRIDHLTGQADYLDKVGKYKKDYEDYSNALEANKREIADYESKPWWKKIGKKAPEPFNGEEPKAPPYQSVYPYENAKDIHRDIEKAKRAQNAHRDAYEKSSLNNENKQIKKQLIRITESDLTNMIIEAANKLKEAYFSNEYDHMLNPPVSYFYNKDTQEITQDVNSNGVWVEFVPNEYSNHGFKIKSAFIDREDGTEEELPEEMTLTPEEIDYIKNWLENNG